MDLLDLAITLTCKSDANTFSIALALLARKPCQYRVGRLVAGYCGGIGRHHAINALPAEKSPCSGKVFDIYVLDQAAVGVSSAEISLATAELRHLVMHG